MKLNKFEKIQFIYDCTGSFFCAFLLGAVCSFFFVSSDSLVIYTAADWRNFHITLPFGVYFVFLCLFWKINLFSKLRISFLWLLVNSVNIVVTLFFSFLINDFANGRLFTVNSKLLDVEVFIIIAAVLILILNTISAFFWYLGCIHRQLIENRSGTFSLNLEN